MTGDIKRLKQDLATMEQAIGNTSSYGPQHVGFGLGLGIGGLITLILGLFTSLLETMPTRAILIPLFLGLPLLLAWILSEKPFQIGTLISTGPAKSGSNTLAVIIAAVIGGFALLVHWAGAPRHLVPSVALMLSAVYLVTLAWGYRHHAYLLLIAAVFFVLAVAYPFVPFAYFDEVFGAGLTVAGLGSAAMLHHQLKHTDPDVATN